MAHTPLLRTNHMTATLQGRLEDVIFRDAATSPAVPSISLEERDSGYLGGQL